MECFDCGVEGCKRSLNWVEVYVDIYFDEIQIGDVFICEECHSTWDEWENPLIRLEENRWYKSD